ncbi:MAG: hypothetical protein HWN65_05360 [Candidatus Helarchaeota archaeon]|nr:hypothetical protein [Candidatus Helarchaeota archaeon]
MTKKFSELSQEHQEKFVESLMEIKSESEKFVIEIVKGTNMELTPTVNSIKKRIEQLEEFLMSSC